MTTILIVHHTPSPALDEMLDAARRGVRDAANELGTAVELMVEPALSCSASHVLDADGYLLGTPANIGYMSGALKHFFDTIYYPTREATSGRPVGWYVHGNNDTTGASTSIKNIVNGMGWAPVAAAVEAVGPPTAATRDNVWNLAATLTASAVES